MNGINRNIGCANVAKERMDCDSLVRFDCNLIFPKFVFNHGLLLENAGPIMLLRNERMEYQLPRLAGNPPFYPFASHDAWFATKRFLSSPGIYGLGICQKAVCLYTTRKFRKGIIGINGIIGSFADAFANTLPDDCCLEVISSTILNI